MSRLAEYKKLTPQKVYVWLWGRFEEGVVLERTTHRYIDDDEPAVFGSLLSPIPISTHEEITYVIKFKQPIGMLSGIREKDIVWQSKPTNPIIIGGLEYV